MVGLDQRNKLCTIPFQNIHDGITCRCRPISEYNIRDTVQVHILQGHEFATRKSIYCRITKKRFIFSIVTTNSNRLEEMAHDQFRQPISGQVNQGEHILPLIGFIESRGYLLDRCSIIDQLPNCINKSS